MFINVHFESFCSNLYCTNKKDVFLMLIKIQLTLLKFNVFKKAFKRMIVMKITNERMPSVGYPAGYQNPAIKSDSGTRVSGKTHIRCILI